MSSPASPLISIYSPDGQLGEVPYERLHDALQAGGKMAVHMTAPDGTAGYIPADKTGDAVKAGGKIIPFNVGTSEPPKEGGVAALGSTLKNIFSYPAAQNPYPGMGVEAKQQAAQESANADAARKAAGYSLPYRGLAPVAQSIGTDVPGMERAAAAGDSEGVLGHAIGSAAPVVAGAVLHAASGAIPEGTSSSVKNALGKTLRSAETDALEPKLKAVSSIFKVVGGPEIADALIPSNPDFIANKNFNLFAQRLKEIEDSRQAELGAWEKLRTQEADALVRRGKEQSAIDAEEGKAVPIKNSPNFDAAAYKAGKTPAHTEVNPISGVKELIIDGSGNDLISRTRKLVVPGEEPTVADLKRAGDLTQAPLARLQTLAKFGDKLAQNEINRRLKND